MKGISNAGKSFVYHKTEKAKIVTDEEAAELYKKGWFDCPTKAKNSETYVERKEHKHNRNR